MLLAALGSVMLRTAGELADGTVTVWTGVRTIATHIVPRITAAADGAARPAPRVVVNLPIAVTDDPEDERAWIAGHFGASSLMPSYRAMFEMEGARSGADVVVVGDERHVKNELHRFADAGAMDFLAVPFGSSNRSLGPSHTSAASTAPPSAPDQPSPHHTGGWAPGCAASGGRPGPRSLLRTTAVTWAAMAMSAVVRPARAAMPSRVRRVVSC